MSWGGVISYNKPRISWGWANEERLKRLRRARAAALLRADGFRVRPVS